MQVREVADVEAFLAAAGHVFDRDAAANNLMLGVVQQLRDQPGSYPEASFWVAADDGEVIAGALRTPPYPVLLADPLREEAVDAFVEAFAQREAAMPGLTANEPWATRFADAWAAATGTPWRLQLGQGVYALRSVIVPPAAVGAPRSATLHDRPLLTRWMEAFEAEALASAVRDERATERALDARLPEGLHGGFTLWIDDAGSPVSLTGWVRISGGARIGPVYTPPERRGRGYASSLVAHVSASALAAGADACFLYTDLANPTSNAVYRRIGYEQVATSSMISFGQTG